MIKYITECKYCNKLNNGQFNLNDAITYKCEMDLKKALYIMKLKRACVLKSQNHECKRNCEYCYLSCNENDEINAYNLIINLLKEGCY